jgi:hypothetical protein
MEETFKELVELKIYPADSEPAKQYGIRASTAVLIDGQIIPLDIALSEGEMENFLKIILVGGEKHVIPNTH